MEISRGTSGEVVNVKNGTFYNISQKRSVELRTPQMGFHLSLCEIFRMCFVAGRILPVGESGDGGKPAILQNLILRYVTNIVFNFSGV